MNDCISQILTLVIVVPFREKVNFLHKFINLKPQYENSNKCFIHHAVERSGLMKFSQIIKDQICQEKSFIESNISVERMLNGSSQICFKSLLPTSIYTTTASKR